ncbi:hypothetical protein [Moorena producens]|uniref:hypothetical protein n=1 Tax=Moorena producens TaxID=1155739 RepID=UPI0011EA6D59|nr:hypothetical protein [Moorena producens]
MRVFQSDRTSTETEAVGHALRTFCRTSILVVSNTLLETQFTYFWVKSSASVMPTQVTIVVI